MKLIEDLKILKRRIQEGDNFPLRKSKKGSFIFIHINKTAGTSIANCIGLPKKRHLTVKQVIKIVGEQNFNQAYKFTVVRNPWSKVVSHYQYRVRTNQTNLGEKPIPFKEWVLKTYGPEKDPAYFNFPQMFMPQVDWLKNSQGEICIDKVIKFEELPEAFEEVSEKLGLTTKLPMLNKTVSLDYRKQYDQETKQIIADHFREDIERFHYEF